jgi:hypothetical protein
MFYHIDADVHAHAAASVVDEMRAIHWKEMRVGFEWMDSQPRLVEEEAKSQE